MFYSKIHVLYQNKTLLKLWKCNNVKQQQLNAVLLSDKDQIDFGWVLLQLPFDGSWSDLAAPTYLLAQLSHWDNCLNIKRLPKILTKKYRFQFGHGVQWPIYQSGTN